MIIIDWFYFLTYALAQVFLCPEYDINLHLVVKLNF